jgi:hypothetical protein
MTLPQQSDSLGPVGCGNCISCGQPLDEHEMFHGDECESCKVAYADDDVEGWS